MYTRATSRVSTTSRLSEYVAYQHRRREDQGQYERPPFHDIAQGDDQEKTRSITSLQQGRNQRRPLVGDPKFICKDVEDGMGIVQVCNAERGRLSKEGQGVVLIAGKRGGTMVQERPNVPTRREYSCPRSNRDWLQDPILPMAASIATNPRQSPRLDSLVKPCQDGYHVLTLSWTEVSRRDKQRSSPARGSEGHCSVLISTYS